MTEGRFAYLCIWANRIEGEVYRNSQELYHLSDMDFRTMPEGDLARAEKQLRDLADYFRKKLDEIETARAKRAA
jgi:hypothetical protein